MILNSFLVFSEIEMPIFGIEWGGMGKDHFNKYKCQSAFLHYEKMKIKLSTFG